MSDATGEEVGPLLRRTRALSETDAVLWTVVVVATVGDVLLTMRGTALGLEEANLVVRAMMAAFGPLGLWLVKVAATSALVVGWALLPDRPASVVLALFALVTLTVTGYNAVLFVASGLV